MIRSAILFLLCIGVLLLVSPFVVCSFLIEERGVPMSGQVESKQESVTVRGSSWMRSLQVRVRYEAPQSEAASFTTPVTVNRFDELRVGAPVPIRFLRSEDVPQLPGAKVLNQLHVLPRARLADYGPWTGFLLTFEPIYPITLGLLVPVLLIVIWRVTRFPGFSWIVGVCGFAIVAIVFVSDYPVPTAAPKGDVRSVPGTVKNIDRIKRLYSGRRSRGFEAAQPIQLVEVEFIPEGHTERVLAVDLIDAGSVAGLKRDGPVRVEYQVDKPRIAYIQGAGRHFAERNGIGIAIELLLAGAVLLVLLMGGKLLGKGYRRLVNRTRT